MRHHVFYVLGAHHPALGRHCGGLPPGLEEKGAREEKKEVAGKPREKELLMSERDQKSAGRNRQHGVADVSLGER